MHLPMYVVYMDPMNGDLWSVESITGDEIVLKDPKGDVKKTVSWEELENSYMMI